MDTDDRLIPRVVVREKATYELNGYPYTSIYYYCPNCHKCYGTIDNTYKMNYYAHNYCYECGQRLLWPLEVKEYMRRKAEGLSYTKCIEDLYDAIVKEKENEHN